MPLPMNEYAPAHLRNVPPDEFIVIPGAERSGYSGNDIWYSVAGDPKSPKTIAPHITDYDLYQKVHAAGGPVNPPVTQPQPPPLPPQQPPTTFGPQLQVSTNDLSAVIAALMAFLNRRA